jgi:hypothetical protein
MTGKGTPRWTKERDDTNPTERLVRKQSGKASYPLALKEGTSIKDGLVEANFRPNSGSEDRAGRAGLASKGCQQLLRCSGHRP